MAKLNFVLIDYENVQPKNMSLLLGGSFKVKVFVGKTQTKVPLETAKALQQMGADAEYVEMEGDGQNALDFHIAYYVGKLSAENPDAYFHIISKDTGFDPLMRYLAKKDIRCQRRPALLDIPLLAIAAMTTPLERTNGITEHLKKLKGGRPRTAKTLGTTINALFGKKLSDIEVAELLKQLEAKGVIKEADGKISYSLDD